MSFGDVSLTLLDGFAYTCLLFAVTWVLAVPLGIVFCRISLTKNRVISKIMQTFIWIIRGTPLMLQIIVVFYVPGLVFNQPSTSRMAAAIAALVINYAVYFSEIFRAGYQSISKGQIEAAEVLGFSKKQIFTRVLLVQIIKEILPPMSNETISLVKDTALARVIAINEVLMAAQKIVATYAIIWVLFYAGIFYLVLNGVLSILLKAAERKLSYFEA